MHFGWQLERSVDDQSMFTQLTICRVGRACLGLLSAHCNIGLKHFLCEKKKNSPEQINFAGKRFSFISNNFSYIIAVSTKLCHPPIKIILQKIFSAYKKQVNSWTKILI